MSEKSTAAERTDYADDTPKINPWTEDRLGYSRFAERLSRIITALRAPNGYVIGLHGIWGSGKSTVLKFVEAYLNKHNDECVGEPVLVINYRPWMVSGHQDLVSAYLKVLTEAFEPDQTKRRSIWKKAGRLFQRTADPLVSTAAAVGAVLSPAAPASVVASKITAASFTKLLDHWLEEPSLQLAHDQLAEKLKEKRRKILVIIDDIDRLQREEIRATMQMVKSVGQLPNVIYLLAYDRQVVWAALDDFPELKGKHPSFAEKIVQQELELPIPSNDALFKMFDQEIRFLLQAIDGEDIRWYNLLRRGARRWLQQPRDVVRLANALKFCGPALLDEVDPKDLLAMEGLRLFDRPAFDWIRMNRDYLFSEGVFQTATDSQRADYGKRFRESLSEATRDDVMTIVGDLFPTRRQALNGERNAFGNETYAHAVSRRGVGTVLGYEAYFSLYPSPDGIPKPIIDEVSRRLDDEDWLTSTLEHYMGKYDRRSKALIADLLQEISIRLFHADRQLSPTQALLKALIRCGEGILKIDEKISELSFPPRASWSNLIADILRTYGVDSAGQHLLGALSASQSPAVWAELYVDRGRELGFLPEPDRNQERLLTDADLTDFGNQLVKLFESAAADKTLASAPYYFNIITAWKYLAGASAPRNWIARELEASPEFLAKLTRGLLVYTVGARGRRAYSMREKLDPDLFDQAKIRAAADRYLATIKSSSGDEFDRVSAMLEGTMQ